MMVCMSSIIFISMLLSCSVVSTSVDRRHDGHSHYKPKKDGPKNVLKDKELLRDYEHIKEDIRDLYNNEFSEKLDEVDLEIFYFQLHDLNGDKKLDGLEMLAAMNHVMNRENEFDPEEINKNPAAKISLQAWWNEKFEEDSKYIDEVLKEEDLDQDGYLSYLEFALGRAKDRADV